ncbi:MAG TPA: protein-methionine-sulfoxide reductase heme-binding subunit MsrQ, partial [Gammaproteobacteria bacterium]|nr:protein-methionine-sulfoxide reductase heme-binding subunit MsrQ [Gammaproteobacteria bacterium]
MTQRSVVIIKALIWAGCLAPFGLLVLQALGYLGGLGANDVETVLNVCGKTGLNLLILTLCVTPIRRSTGINKLVAFRRLFGLFAFFYLSLHFLTYALLDLGLL